MNQNAVFSSGEGDAWFSRNRAHLAGYDPQTDPVAVALAQCAARPRRILEYGCSAGQRLSTLCARHGATGIGIEPSREAIAAATARDPAQAWLVGTVDEHPPVPGGPCDLVILHFVCHWIDRRVLLASLADIDRHLAEGGLLAIGDFLPDFPQRRRYHHRPDAEVFTYKNDYAGMFLATGLYRRLLRRDLAYPSMQPELSTDPQAARMAVDVLLRRPATAIPEI